MTRKEVIDTLEIAKAEVEWNYPLDYAIAIEQAIGIIKEREQGRWIEHKYGFWSFVNKEGERDGWVPDYECSCCGSSGYINNYGEFNFCPQCGAEMKRG